VCCAVCCNVLQCVAVCCSVLQCVAVCCSMLQCVAVCCSVLQCVAVSCSVFSDTRLRHRERERGREGERDRGGDRHETSSLVARRHVLTGLFPQKSPIIEASYGIFHGSVSLGGDAQKSEGRYPPVLHFFSSEPIFWFDLYQIYYLTARSLNGI